jgi:putative hydrolase
MGGFFPGMLGDLLKMLRTDSPLQWDLALQLSQTVASENQPDSNVEPRDRIRLEELSRIAELHVADITGMSTTPSGRAVEVNAVSRSEWARRSLEAWQRLLEHIAVALTPAPAADTAAQDEPDDPFTEGPDLAAVFGQWATAMAPAMIAMQVGSAVGHLALVTLGQYELPVPGDFDDKIYLPVANHHVFAEDWSLPEDDVTIWLAVRDIATHSVLSRPHVRARLEELLVEQARGIEANPADLEARLGEISPSELGDLSAMARLFGDPTALGELVDTPELRRIRAELRALATTIVGYVEWVTDTVAERAIGARGPVREAMRRRRVDHNDEEQAAARLFGLQLGQEDFDRGAAFVRGVIERGGENDLARLWVVETNLPTPAEVDAPGLWIERIHLPELGTTADPPT